MKAKITINTKNIISKIDERIYGSFIEHLGRAVYGGIYDPGHAEVDDMGFREDVLRLVKEIKVPIVRYPGGNFVSGYNWEDGTGPRETRPKKLDLAWFSVETNEIGIDEFYRWAEKADTEIMMAVNLGTRGADDARNFVEYCNLDTPTFYAQLRKKNGFEAPFGIHTWCLGNEMDGPWQICTKTAREYGRLANEAAKVMKWTDESIEVVACGSSGPYMETFGEWEREVLRQCYENVDYLSLHNYFGNRLDDSKEYLSQSIVMDEFIKKVVTICDEIKEEKKSDKTIMLSFDEWNVWFHSNEADKKIPKWQMAPHLLEDHYNFEDALVVGCLMITLLKHSDRVKIACLAQLVNAIAPIMTTDDGRCYKQTIFYPYMLTSLNGRGYALNTDVICEVYDTEERCNIPYIEAIVVKNYDESTLTLFAVNRSLNESCEIEFQGFDDYLITKHTILYCDDLKEENTVDAEKVKAYDNSDISGKILLPKHSWNMIRFTSELL